jgi:hypothetical protein
VAEPISVPIEADPEELKEIGYEFMRANIPGWDDSRGDPDSQLIAACAQIIAEGAGPASDVPLAIIRYLGRWVDGLLPIDATPAQTTATVTVLDDLGYSIPDGTRFEVRTSGDTGVVFFTVGDVIIPPGSTSTTAGQVVLVAETPGAEGSGLPIDSEVVPVDSLAWVDTVTLTAITTGGVDAETDEQYLGRWVTLRQLSNDTPILAVDAAALIQALIPGIGRTLALDNYNPADDTFGNEKMISVGVADSAGGVPAGALITAAEALIESKRELNFECHVFGATYNVISVGTAFVTYPGFDVAGVEAAVEAAIAAYFDPAVFSTPPGADTTVWLAKTHVRYLDVVSLVDHVEGVDYITALTFGAVRQVTGLASTDVLTLNDHGFALNDPVDFITITGGAPLAALTTYYARDITTDTFKLSLTPGGAAIGITTDLTAGTARSLRTSDVPLDGPAPLTRPGPILAVGTAP